MHVQGFSGRAATTTLHDATETGISISGIFQAAEDFAVLCLYNAYDYFNHLRLKPLPRTGLSGLKLEFDLEYDHALDGAMRFDANKYPSVAWDSVTFVCGAGDASDIYEVRLRDHAVAVSGSETPATCRIDVDGIWPSDGIDHLHLFFRDTRYTAAHTDAVVETQLTASVQGNATAQWISVQSVTGFETGDRIYIERTGTNEELTQVLAIQTSPPRLQCVVTKNHPVGSYITAETGARHLLKKMAEIINTPGASVPGRYGPDQSGVISAASFRTGPSGSASSALVLTFVAPALPNARYGKLGNLDRILVTAGHSGAGTQSINWTGDRSPRFKGGDDTTRYHITLDFTQPLLDKLGRTVPMNDCRKIYMVFAPRFEPTEAELEDGSFLTASVQASDTALPVNDTAMLTGGRYFIGNASSEERVLLVAVNGSNQITVQRGYQNSTPSAWPAGTRIKKLSPITGVAADIEWRATISNITVTGDRTLKVGGGSPRIEESDGRCKYTGAWENYAYNAGWPTQWWSMGHARRTTSGQVTIRYSQTVAHDLYLGTFLSTGSGQISVSVDGDSPTAHDLYLNEFGGTTANIRLRTGLAAGIHTPTITATGGGYFYFDYLWPLLPQDVPDPPQEYPDVSLALDFDTDHGYRKPPTWHVWQLQRLGFKGHADVYMGVFWNNKRRRIGMSYPYATVQFSGTPVPGDVVWISISGTQVNHAIGYGETLQDIVSHFRAAINGMFAGVWADDNFGTSTTLRIQSKAPAWTFPGVAVSSPNSVTLTLADNLGTAGSEGDWELIDAVSPVMTEGVRRWIRDLAGQFAAAGIKASFAFSMEVYRPPVEMAARYWDGDPVELPVPSTQMHFGARVRTYLKQMYKECADEIAAAGLPVVLQFGETQWWYFPNASGMPYYDDETKAAFETLYGRPMHRFLANTDDPNDDIETADFLRDRTWAYCQEVIAHVRQSHPSAVFECLWPLDANQGKPAPDPAFRRLNMHVNLPNEWKTSAYGVKYFRSEGFDYDVWQKNTVRMRQTMEFPLKLGRPPEECMYLTGIFGPPDPPMAQAYGMWRYRSLHSFSFWALDQFCLNSRPVPLDVARPAVATAVAYHKPRAARSLEAVVAQPVQPNQFALNTRRFNE
jgi:hypothetical protein